MFFATNFSSLALIKKKFGVQSAGYIVWSNRIAWGKIGDGCLYQQSKSSDFCKEYFSSYKCGCIFYGFWLMIWGELKPLFWGLKNFKSKTSFQITKITSPKASVSIWKMYLSLLRHLEIKKSIATNFSACSIWQKASIADLGLQFQLSLMCLWHSKNLHIPQKIPHHRSSRSIPCCCNLLKQTQWYHIEQLESEECFHNIMRKHLACAMNNNRSSNQRKSLLSTMRNNVS